MCSKYVHTSASGIREIRSDKPNFIQIQGFVGWWMTVWVSVPPTPVPIYTDDAQLTILDIVAVNMKARQACNDDSAQVCTRRPKEVRNGHSAYCVQYKNRTSGHWNYVTFRPAAALADKPQLPPLRALWAYGRVHTCYSFQGRWRGNTTELDSVGNTLI